MRKKEPKALKNEAVSHDVGLSMTRGKWVVSPLHAALTSGTSFQNSFWQYSLDNWPFELHWQLVNAKLMLEKDGFLLGSEIRAAKT